MAQPAPARSKINTKATQARNASGPAVTRRPARGSTRVRGDARESARGRAVIELDAGITVYPPQKDGGRWRAVWMEDGRRRYCEAVTEAKLAAKLTKITERLDADAPGMERPGADLIAWYLSPDRLPADEQWSRKHAHTQQRLCERFVAPVIADLACQDIRVADMQRIVNAASTAQEGGRLHALVSALVGAGIRGGYLANARLKEVHWQAGRDRPGAVPTVTVAGESPLFVDPAEIPGHADVAKLGQALAERGSQVHEPMAQLAAYSGLRWGELAALTAGQVDHAGRVITVDRKVVEIGGQLYEEAPKNRKRRRTIYPRRTPEGYPLADRVAARIQAARREQEAGTNPLALVFPSPKGKHWRANNFGRRVLMPSYRAVGWRGEDGGRPWTWHSLRHVFCTTALFTWQIEASDVSRLAGHSNVRITLDLYVGATVGVLDRARSATD
jgi:integrase